MSAIFIRDPDSNVIELDAYSDTHSDVKDPTGIFNSSDIDCKNNKYKIGLLSR